MAGLHQGMTPADRVVLGELTNQYRDTMRGVLGDVPGQAVALLDFPNHQNAGDTMIWGGERRHLQALGLDVAYVADVRRYRRSLLDLRAPGSPVLLHGGGNFGDLWTEFQDFREAIVPELHDRPVIQLPQSIWFQSPVAAERANRIFSEHPDFTLLVRDHDSMARAAEHLPDVRAVFCPDSALGLGPQASRQDRAPVVLLRQDKEAPADGTEALAGVSGSSADWGLDGMESVAWKLARVPGRLHRSFPDRSATLYPAVSRSYDALAALNLRSARRLIGGASILLTDRLHAHVLACLMGIPHVVMENSYGKIGPIYRDYTHRFSTANFAQTPGEAMERWTELRSELSDSGDADLRATA